MTHAPGARAAAWLLACVFASAAGCASAPEKRSTGTKPPSASSSSSTSTITTPEKSSAANTDPCAMRLHDVCGPLLLYYATHRALPAKLEQLSQVPGFETVNDFTCPASGKPYVYNPAGIPAPDRTMRVIIYDAVAAHDGTRWGIAIPTNTGGGGTLVAKVVAVPEGRFSRTQTGD